MKVASIIILLLLAVVSTPIVLCAQKITIDADAKTVDISPEFNDIDVHLNAVKKRPEFSAGKKAWQHFLRSNINIRIPFANKAKPGTYWVLIRFIVGRDGKLRAIGADTNCGYGMEAEVIRCIQKSANWIPAETKTGIKVSFTMRTAVTFVVKQNDVTIGFE
jgi:hypothetical protein